MTASGNTESHGTSNHGTESPGTSDHGTDIVPAAEHEVLPDRFENPGLPPHQHRSTDIDAAAAKRAERVVASLFGLSALGTVLTVVGFFAVRFPANVPANMDRYLHQVRVSTTVLGLGLFLALFGIGVGAVHWAKTLMPDDERTEDRHPLRGSDQDRDDALTILKEGAAESGLGRRPLIRNSLVGALALAPLPAVVFLRDLGPLPGKDLDTTFWKQGLRMVRDPEDPEADAIKASDLTIGSVVHVMPEGIEKTTHVLEERAKAAVLLIRIDPSQLDEASLPGSYQGIVAYSKICTHLGCPVALYEQRTHHLLCPCHQSTFDVRQNCKVIYGPAKRPLPQLPITVDDEGYLVAKSGFDQPVGPSFWERA